MAATPQNRGAVAIVTGANRGLGLAIVKQLCLKFDGDVYLTARDVERGQAAVAELAAQGLKAFFHTLDVDSRESIVACRDFMVQHYGGVDILINNAARMTVEESDPGRNASLMMRTNFWGLYDACRLFLPHLRKHGRIVNIGTRHTYTAIMVGQGIEHIRALYDCTTTQELERVIEEYVKNVKASRSESDEVMDRLVSKTAGQVLTRLLQKQVEHERPSDNILINCCCPGLVSTRMTSFEGVSPDQGAETPVYLALLPSNADTPPRGEMLGEEKVLPFTLDRRVARDVVQEQMEIYPQLKKFIVLTALREGDSL